MLTTNELLRQEWTRFRRPGRLIAMAAAALVVLALGLLYASGNHASCDGPCPTDPTGPDGSLVSDQFYFLHRDLGENGSITVRMTSMTGTITYPPPGETRAGYALGWVENRAGRTTDAHLGPQSRSPPSPGFSRTTVDHFCLTGGGCARSLLRSTRGEPVMTSGWTADLLLGGIVLLGASVQWLTGMGFALVSVPALVLVLGPAEGVVLANCAAGAISVVGLAGGWRRVRLGAMVPLVVASACTVPAGTWVAARLPEPVLLAGMGALVSVAVLLVMRGARVSALRGVQGALAAGAAGGFMNSSAGVGGPPVSLYAVNAGWTVRDFVPNAQFYGVVVNAFSVAANGVPHLSTPVWLLALAAMAAGAGIGKALAERVPERRARLLVLWLALAGGLTTTAKGLWGL